MEIKNSNGVTVKKATRYPTEANPKMINMIDFTSNKIGGIDDDVYSDKIDLSTLSSGTYSCVVTVHLSNGETRVARNFTFAK